MIEREHCYRLDGLGRHVACQSKVILGDGSTTFTFKRINDDGSKSMGLNGLPGNRLVIGATRSIHRLTLLGYHTLFIPEGPKDCESILDLDLPAVSGFGTSIAPRFGRHLFALNNVLMSLPEGGNIVCIGDADEAGRRYAEKMAEGCWMTLNEWRDRPDVSVSWTTIRGDTGTDVSDIFSHFEMNDRARIEFLHQAWLNSKPIEYRWVRKKMDADCEQRRRDRLASFPVPTQAVDSNRLTWKDLIQWCRRHVFRSSDREAVDAAEVSGPCPLCGGVDRFWVNRFGPWCRHCCPDASDRGNRKRFLRALFKLARGG